MTFSIRKELEKLSADERHQVEQRLAQLQAVMQSMEFETEPIHDDSRLAWGYAKVVHLDVEDVAHELMCVNALHSKTDYSQQVQHRLKLAADSLHSMYPGVSWRCLWQTLVQYGVPVVKLSQKVTTEQLATCKQE
jgi:hypothetical protein